MIDIDTPKRIHFVGIGGIGVSALAYFFLRKGCKISGSDLVASSTIERLQDEGMKIRIGPHAIKNIPRLTDMVIQSPAVHSKNPEIVHARLKKIPVYTYPELLGELTCSSATIAVSGTHGKSTTTALISLLLTESGLDPTVFVGTKLKEFNGLNCRVGKSGILVIEADEFAGSFLHYWPKVIVLTNIEKDHMDYFKDMATVFRKYKEYIGHLLETDGVLVANNDMYSEKAPKNKSHSTYKRVIDDFISKGGNCVFYSSKMLGKKGLPTLKELKNVLQMPGDHNISNACAALKVAEVLGISDYPIRKAWGSFTGPWRRFEILNRGFNADQNADPPAGGTLKNRRKIGVSISVKSAETIFVSDYAHHPTEIKATLMAAREKFGNEREIICIYQPHQYQRTFYLFKDFVGAFDLSDTLYLLDIYNVSGRESAALKKRVNSKRLAQAIGKRVEYRKPHGTNKIFLQKVDYISSMDNMFNVIKKEYLRGNFVVLIMGAGDIINLADRVKKELL